MHRCLKVSILQKSNTDTVEDTLWALCVYQDQTLNFLNDVYCISLKVQFYGTVLAMILNVAMISCLLNDCANRSYNVFYDCLVHV